MGLESKRPSTCLIQREFPCKGGGIYPARWLNEDHAVITQQIISGGIDPCSVFGRPIGKAAVVMLVWELHAVNDKAILAFPQRIASFPAKEVRK